jgi:hypothetical protein
MELATPEDFEKMCKANSSLENLSHLLSKEHGVL